MTKYREILRLSALGLSLRNIEKSLHVSQHTILKVQRRAKELSIVWPLDETFTDEVLEQQMFPKSTASKSTKRMPDYDYVRKELLRNGVNKKLLWTEYLEECQRNGDDALMYSQFCYYIQQNEQKRRATMHIPRKPGQQIEVDWAGDPAEIIDPYTGEITSAWIFVGVMTYSQYAFVEAFINEQQKAWITAALRNEQFFSLAELNTAIRKKLKKYNDAPFQKKDGSRQQLFLEDEKPLLMPLPATRFELSELRTATVQFNYHIAVDKMYYSVPYQYIKDKVDVRMTDTTIEIFKNHRRIASHKRLYGRPGQYSTVIEHMPQDHQKYLEWNGDRFREWAETIGINTYKVVDCILTSGRIEQQSYRACMGLLKLAERQTPQRLENACTKALKYSNSPSYKSIKNILSADKTVQPEFVRPVKTQDSEEQHGITRGAGYYGGKRS